MGTLPAIHPPQYKKKKKKAPKRSPESRGLRCRGRRRRGAPRQVKHPPCPPPLWRSVCVCVRPARPALPVEPSAAGSGAGSTAEGWARPSPALGGWARGWAKCCACMGRGPRVGGESLSLRDSHRARFPVSYACLSREWCSQPVSELFIDSCQLFFFF